MTFLSSFLLGLVQGIAEFLPISSSGHLAIAQNLLGMSDAGTVPEFLLLHLGTLVAVFVAYWADIKDMVLEFFRGAGDLIHHSTPNPVPPARRLILLIILGTLPLFVVLPVKDAVQSLSNSMVFIGAALILALFCFLVLRGYWIALHARDRFGGLLAGGITTMIAVQTFLNVAVVTNFVPNTGISLPFFSYGGTALILQLAEMGIVLNISRVRYQSPQRAPAAERAPQAEVQLQGGNA